MTKTEQTLKSKSNIIVKRVLLLFVLAFAFNTINAQSVTEMIINKSDGSNPTYLIDDVDSVTFVGTPLVVGDSYKGGIVFYLDGLGGGLIAAENDLGLYKWDDDVPITINTNARGKVIGTGANNTSTIVSICCLRMCITNFKWVFRLVFTFTR